jgi:hypothetical protein
MFSWHVFNENRVEGLPSFGLRFGVELDTAQFISVLCSDQRSLCILRVLEADEAIAARSVVFIKRNFAGYDLTKLSVNFFEFTRGDVLWDFSDESVLVNNLGDVLS